MLGWALDLSTPKLATFLVADGLKFLEHLKLCDTQETDGSLSKPILVDLPVFLVKESAFTVEPNSCRTAVRKRFPRQRCPESALDEFAMPRQMLDALCICFVAGSTPNAY